MKTSLRLKINSIDKDLTMFLNSPNDGVFYLGHASILVRLNRKKFLFDFIHNMNFYRNSWIFFPNQILDKRLFNVSGIFVSHIHQDHYDPVLLRKFNKLKVPIYILDGRKNFITTLKKEKIKFNLIPINKKTFIDNAIWVYGCLHEYNDIDSSLVISNNNLTVYHGNDNFITEKSLIPLKKKVGKIDIACIPFAYINYYPYLLNNLSRKVMLKEGRRLENLFMNYGIKQSKILKPSVVIPFGSNLFHIDDPKSNMNKAVATPVDFVNYAQSKNKSSKNIYKTILSGDYCLKINNKIKCKYQNIRKKEFNDKLIKFTLSKKNLIKKISDKKIVEFNNTIKKNIQKKIKKNPNKLDHNFVISSKSKQNKKIIINLKNDKVSYLIDNKLPFNSHYFILEDNEFNLWVNNKMTFEEVLGTRRFRYERYPNIYQVKVNQIYTNYL
jgi:L-ascorbate metabolism protein UlaG (beta-lactamase superfamily)